MWKVVKVRWIDAKFQLVQAENGSNTAWFLGESLSAGFGLGAEFDINFLEKLGKWHEQEDKLST